MKHYKILFTLLALMMATVSNAAETDNTKVYPPITPAWIFGHIVWEDEKNTQTAIEGLVDEYLSRDIPVHATIIDSPWSTAYNNFIWDTNRYPQYDAMINGFNAKGVKVMLWLTSCVNLTSTGCPQDKCEEYDYVKAQNYGVNNSEPSEWWKGKGIQIDFTNPEATQWWYGQLDKVWREGIYGWKVDQGEVYFGDQVTTSIGTMTNEQFRKYYYNAMEDYIKSKTQAGANIGRPYSHQRGYHSDPAKMSMGWCGDFGGDWNGLKLQIDNIYRSAQAGYGAVGTEIAGFMGAKANKTQFIRYAQFGATTACMINGGENGAFTNHLPWWHGDDVTAIYRDAVKLHTSLVPYLFSTVVEAHEQGGSLMKDVNLTDESHRLGNDLFTKAITSDAVLTSVTLPTDGEWIDWFTGEAYEAGKTYMLKYPLERFPLFVRKGAILPMDMGTEKTTLRFYPAATGSEATLHLPQGDGIEYDVCQVAYDPVQAVFTIADAHARTYVLEMCGVKAVSSVEGTQSWSLNSETGVLSIEVSSTTSATIRFQGLELAELPKGNDYQGDDSMIPSRYYSEPSEGKFYLYNVAYGRFLERLNNNYPGLTDTPAEVTLTKSGDGYTIMFGDGKYLKTGYYKNQYLWTDGTANLTEGVWTFAPIENSNKNTYRLQRIAEDTWNGTTGIFYVNGTNASTTPTAECLWALVDPADYATISLEKAIPASFRSSLPTEAGDYYIYDVLTQTFLNTATRTLTEEPAAPTTLTPTGGKFLLSGVSGKYLKIGVYKGQYLWSDGDETSTKWSIEAGEDTEDDKLFYIYSDEFTEGNAEVKGKTMYITGTNASSTKPLIAQWILVTEDDYQRYLSGETTSIGETAGSKVPTTDGGTNIYDLQGRKVTGIGKHGIYVIQGKKVVF